MLHARAVLDLAAALDDELEERGGTRLLTEIELPLVDLLAQMERTGIAVDGDHLSSLEDHFAAEVKLAAEEAFAVIGKEINLGSPKQLQVVLFDELEMPKTKRTKTGYTTDADALQALYVKTDHPFLLHLLRHRDVTRLRSDHRGAAQDRLARRADPHDVQPADRRHRPALQHRPQPAEHPDPHRGGPPDPRGLRRRLRLRVPADRRLQPDRDADHGPPVRGRPADRGVQVGPRLPLDHRLARLRRPRRRRHRRDARQDQGDELRPRLRPLGVRPRRPARHRPRRGPRADGRVLRDLRRHPRLPRRRSSTRPAAPATPRPSWAAAATCPT